MKHSSMRALVLACTAASAAVACSSAHEGDEIEASEADLVDSRWIGTFRNDSAHGGELRTLSLLGDGVAAFVVQECTATSCTSVEHVGTYELEAATKEERRLDLVAGKTKRSFRSRVNATSYTIDAQSIALLEIDPTTGAPREPVVSLTLDRSKTLWCRTTADCDRQVIRAERGPATDCVASMCSWDASAVCKPDASTDPLVVEPVQAQAPSARTRMASAWTGDRMFVFGGRSSDGETILGDGALYDPATSSWSPLGTKNAPPPREGARAAGVGGRAVVVGGLGAGLAVLADAHVYDGATSSWSPVAVGGAVAKDWRGALVAAGNAVFRPGVKHLLYRIDPAARTVSAVTDPPEMAELPNGELDPATSMVVGTPSSVVVLAPTSKLGGASATRHTVWRMFELDAVSSTWTVADVGLGPIARPTTIAYASGTLVLHAGENARTGLGGVEVIVDLASKKADVISIGAGDASPSESWLSGWGGAGQPAFRVDHAASTAFDTFDVARHAWVHRSGGSTGAGRPQLPGRRTNEAVVWTGTELLVWGGTEARVVNGFDVALFPRYVVRFAPARCTQ